MWPFEQIFRFLGAPDVHVACSAHARQLEVDLSRMRTDLVRMSDELEHERLERKHLVAEVEEHLDRATKRYGKARAAESRTKETEEAPNGEEAPTSDAEARVRILRSRPSPW